MNPESQIIIRENFISRADCDFLINGFNKRKPAASLSKVSDNILPVTELDRIEKEVIQSVVNQVIKIIGVEFKDSVRLNWAGISARTVGNFCEIHSDDSKCVCPRHGDNQPFLQKIKCLCPDRKFIENHTPFYNYTALLYLNSNHIGGDIYFQDTPVYQIYRKKIEAAVGKLVLAPNGKDFYHEVDEVTEGKRYSLTMWFTRN